MVTGAVGALVLIYLSPTVQLDILKHSSAWFPLRNPALVTMPLSFLLGAAVSLLRPAPAEAAGFDGMERRVHLGPA